ncbi:MAG: hypothetical protein WBD40_05135 [Tepidisphaeraceae bacterium]
MADRQTQLPAVTFWPRPTARDGPIQRDIFCDKCGYNLRGLKERICPECGAEFKVSKLAGSQLPWKQREAVGFLDAYWRTVKLVLFHPRRFGLEVWEGGRIHMRDARAFRWITIAHAYFPLLGLWLALAGPHLGASEMSSFTGAMAALLFIWLRGSTSLLVTFFRKQTMSADVQRRLVALGHFACASLALSPIHLACLALCGAAYKLEGQDSLLFIAAACVWGAFILFQLFLWWMNSLLLMREAMNVNEGELAMIGLGFAVVWILHLGFWLGLVPYLLYVVGNALRLF